MTALLRLINTSLRISLRMINISLRCMNVCDVRSPAQPCSAHSPNDAVGIPPSDTYVRGFVYSTTTTTTTTTPVDAPLGPLALSPP
jgi:hypothetical protein